MWQKGRRGEKRRRELGMDKEGRECKEGEINNKTRKVKLVGYR